MLPFPTYVTLTDHMREGALSGFGALIGKNGRLVASSAQRFGGTVVDRPPRRLQPLRNLQPAGRQPHALVAGEGRARGL